MAFFVIVSLIVFSKSLYPIRFKLGLSTGDVGDSLGSLCWSMLRSAWGFSAGQFGCRLNVFIPS